jgi:hypothetical protein
MHCYAIIGLVTLFSLVRSFLIGKNGIFSFHSYHPRITRYTHSTIVKKMQPLFQRTHDTFNINSGQKALWNLEKSWKMRDCQSFDKHLYSLGQDVKNRRLVPTSDMLKSISSMIDDLSIDFTELHTANVLRALSNIGYSTRYNDDYLLLSKLKKLYMRMDPTLKTAVVFLFSLYKLNYSWKEEEDKEAILLLIEKTSNEPMTNRQYTEFVTSIAGMQIPWNSLTKSCHQNMLGKLGVFKNELESTTVAMVLYTFSSLYGLNIKKVSQVDSSTFLTVVEHCFRLLKLNFIDDQCAREVRLCFLSFEFILCS